MPFSSLHKRHDWATLLKVHVVPWVTTRLSIPYAKFLAHITLCCVGRQMSDDFAKSGLGTMIMCNRSTPSAKPMCSIQRLLSAAHRTLYLLNWQYACVGIFTTSGIEMSVPLILTELSQARTAPGYCSRTCCSSSYKCVMDFVKVAHQGTSNLCLSSAKSDPHM